MKALKQPKVREVVIVNDGVSDTQAVYVDGKLMREAVPIYVDGKLMSRGGTIYAADIIAAIGDESQPVIIKQINYGDDGTEVVGPGFPTDLADLPTPLSEAREGDRQMITEAQREELVEAVNAADLACPEQVCDMVEAAGDRDGYDAAVKVLESAKANDAAERKSLGIDE